MQLYRDIEIHEAIRRDDLSYLMNTRHEKILEYMLVDDVHPMLTDKPSTLMIAAFYGSTRCFKYLFNDEQYDYKDERVLLRFLMNLLFLLRHCIHYAAAGGNLSIFLNFESDSSLNSVYDQNGNTPLHYAAKFGRLSIVQYIFSQGCDIFTRNKDGWTAGHFAAACGSLPILQVLHNAGDKFLLRNCAAVLF